VTVVTSEVTTVFQDRDVYCNERLYRLMCYPHTYFWMNTKDTVALKWKTLEFMFYSLTFLGKFL